MHLPVLVLTFSPVFMNRSLFVRLAHIFTILNTFSLLDALCKSFNGDRLAYKSFLLQLKDFIVDVLFVRSEHWAFVLINHCNAPCTAGVNRLFRLEA